MTTQFVTSFIPYCDSQSPLVTLNIARGSDFYSRQRVAWNCWKVVEVPIDITQVTHGTSHSLHSNYKRLSGVFCKKGLICRVVTVSQEITNHDIRVAGRRRWYFQYSDTSCKHWIGTKNNMIIWSKLFKERITVRKWTKKSIASQRNYDAS